MATEATDIVGTASRHRCQSWAWNNMVPLLTIDWKIDAAQQVLIDTGKTLEQTAEFNDWESLLAKPT